MYLSLFSGGFSCQVLSFFQGTVVKAKHVTTFHGGVVCHGSDGFHHIFSNGNGFTVLNSLDSYCLKFLAAGCSCGYSGCGFVGELIVSVGGNERIRSISCDCESPSARRSCQYSLCVCFFLGVSCCFEEINIIFYLALAFTNIQHCIKGGSLISAKPF